MTSPSIPTTSVMLVDAADTVAHAATWTIMSSAEAIWVRIARDGRLMPAMPISVLKPVSASRGRLAWMVPSEPSVAVFIACSMSTGLGPAHLAQDDAVGAHAQRVLDQVAHIDRAGPFQVGRAGFQPHDMRLLQLQLGRVLDGDDALALVDQLADSVEQGGLAEPVARPRSGC